MSFDPQELTAALQTIPWFQELSEDHFNLLCGISYLRKVEPGEELFKEGDKQDYLYIVLEGRVAVDISVPGRGRMRIFTAEPMDIVGWSSPIPIVRQRTAGARAVLPGRLISIDAPKLRRLCEENHELGYVVMRRQANVIAGRLLITRLQLLDMFAHPDQEVGRD